jgi:hypothetical protein
MERVSSDKGEVELIKTQMRYMNISFSLVQTEERLSQGQSNINEAPDGIRRVISGN